MSRICQGCGGVLGRDCYNEQECMWIADQQEQDYRNQQERQQQEQVDNREPPEPDWELMHYQHTTADLLNALQKAKETIKALHGSVCGGYIPSFKPKQVSEMIIIGNIHQHPELLNPSSTTKNI